MSDWQPIETAPRDFTRVLVFSKRHGIFIAHQNGFGSWSSPLEEDERVTEPLPYLQSAQEAEITHWMPLPEPPYQKGTKK